MKFLEKNDEQIIEYTAAGNDNAKKIMLQVPADKLRVVAFDLADMEMTGIQVVEAHKFCGGFMDIFIESCAKRDDGMIEYVNTFVPGRTARKGAPQTTAPQVNQAVKSLIDNAAKENNLQRLDQGSEAVHAFFLKMMTEMQKRKEFSGNFRLNVGGMVEGATFANFRITLVGLVDAENRELSVEQQPTKEDERISEEILSRAEVEEAANAAGQTFVDELLTDGEAGKPVNDDDNVFASAPQDMLTRVSYMLAVHEATMKKMTHPDFHDPHAEWRWSYAVSLSEMAEIVDAIVANGTEIDVTQIRDFKAGNAFLRMNSVRVVPELEDTKPQLNG